MSNLAENLKIIRGEMAAAMKEAGRTDDLLLVGVTKTFPVDVIEESIACNILDVGENKAQEFTEKYAIIKDNVNWHFIGHLQKNKVKYIVGKARLIHSVDSLELASEISRRAEKLGVVQAILIEVNISGEESKFGVPREGVITLLEGMKDLPGIQVSGLMTMAPNVEDDTLVRGVFRGLRELRDEIRSLELPHVKMDFLSMGMSQDFRLAILEGANIIRVGSSLYGKR